MKDNDSQRSRVRSAAGAVSILVLFGLLVVVFVGLVMVTDTAQAGLKTTHWVDAWDYSSNPPAYAHSLINIAFNGSWVPFLHQKDWDTIVVTDSTGSLLTDPACVVTGTRYAGIMYYTLGYTDTTGERGFQETAQWRLIDCDLNGDGKFDNADQRIFPTNGTNNPPPYPPKELRPCVPDDPVCNLISQDVQQACTNNTCAVEIQTTFFLNLDTNCDGTPDILPANSDPSFVCFYAEARTPRLAPTESRWQGNLQTRITEAGGDKTVNFHVMDYPTAIDLASFGAARQRNGILVSWETANELDNLGFNLYRSAWRNGNRAKVNGRLIASVAPGSATGATYTFLDESAAPGRSYYYWLEALDLSGNSSEYVSALVKGLPGRRRPMPAP